MSRFTGRVNRIILEDIESREVERHVAQGQARIVRFFKEKSTCEHKPTLSTDVREYLFQEQYAANRWLCTPREYCARIKRRLRFLRK